MTEREPLTAKNIRAEYHDGQLLISPREEVIPWDTARQMLAEARYFWFGTVRPDGQPHIRPVLAVWVEGNVYTSTNPNTRKGRNLTTNRRCSIVTSTDHLDLIVEGEASRLTDQGRLQQIAEAYQAKYGWTPEVHGDAFQAPYGAPTAGAPPYHVYVLVPQVVFALGTDETFAARSTRWQF